MSNKQKIIITLFIVLVTSGSFFYWSKQWRVNKVKTTEKQSVTTNNNQSAKLDIYKIPIAVVLDNFPETRPQTGLSKADIVYETVTEGGITRFLAVYKSGQAENIGPIRSARTYFAELANELGAIFAHVGGNSDVLEELRSNKYKNLINLDQFFWEAYFKRISSIKMPHNVFSSTQKLYGILNESNKKLEPLEKLPIVETFLGESVAKKIRIDFLLRDYLVEYEYNEQQKSYERHLAGKPHVDAETKKVLETHNIIVQFVKTWPVKSDTPLSLGMDLDTGGKAIVFAGGKVIEGTWKKTDRTRYFNAMGQEISLIEGNLWIELVPEDRKDFVSWQ